ncbi:LPPG:FO 2-phospho-L-lactate transferase [Thalassovita autumnalis]|uniref:LPPG:FO 2-phospho-L-lactate transferase n=1 Tax=Thalassovita autumnalis TaxID=2072972 RepID=A0A0N7LXC9_9RHOB|nr:2-phospho-L-lactate transferase [Thalassovita autumnalis]CUH66895.1 LPPG:FO 2-phospho-L-lactate transferase [Thalassovita autumnalis]CUH71551.1 LPPG:FO 2-phospho-L-lactate transferase [Thalassovita autumnalis]
MNTPMKVTLLAGGVGGAKMAEGLAALPDVDLSIIGNVADDDAFHGLWVSPDIDTLTYSLADVIDRTQGWGVADEGHRALQTLSKLGAETWMTLGDRDFGLHIHRTMRRAKGDRPSDIARDVANAFGVKPQILLPTDDVVQTRVRTDDGWLSFQEYFVRERCAPEVRELAVHGLSDARPTPEALEAIAGADLIVVAPSNPLVSIAPILDVPGIRAAVSDAAALKVAVSPFIGGKVVKGPADKMMKALGERPDALGVARRYASIIDALMIDRVDAPLGAEIRAEGLDILSSATLMKSRDDKARLASEIVDYARAQQLETRIAS